MAWRRAERDEKLKPVKAKCMTYKKCILGEKSQENVKKEKDTASKSIGKPLKKYAGE